MKTTSITKQDDRTPAQRHTHVWGVASRCAWACHPDVDVHRVEQWVRSRSEMRYVFIVDLRTYRAPRGTAHFHIYVCNPDHVAARY